MHAHARTRRITAPLSVLVTAALTISMAGTALASTPASGSQSLSSQIAAAYRSPSGVQLRGQLASIFSDPALPAAAKALIQSDGPSGKNDLTDFQTDLLKALVTETGDPSLVAARLTGKALTFNQWADSVREQIELLRNPAVSTLARAGWQLHNSPQLPADIAAVASNDSVTYSAFTPPATANQGGSAALDSVIGDIAALRTSQAFTDYASKLTPVLQDSRFSSLLKGQSPLDIASFLPVSDMIALLIPNDHDPAILDVVKASLEILGGLAALGAVLLSSPIVIAGVTITATGLAITAAVSAIAVGVLDLATSLDCDHDGDPWDPADVPGQEC